MIDYSELMYQPFPAQREEFSLFLEGQSQPIASIPSSSNQTLPSFFQDLQATTLPFLPSKKRRPIPSSTTTKKTFYQKNICKYVIRKAIRCLSCQNYRDEITLLCKKVGLQDVDGFMRYYLAMIEKISGIERLKVELKSGSLEAKAFRVYLEWFLRKRYVREIVGCGHMADSHTYINYKNKVLLPGLRQLDHWTGNKPFT